MADILIARKVAGMNKTDFKHLQLVLGINYAPGSCFFDPDLRPHLKVRDQTLFDWMHCLLCGGIVQVEAAKFIQELRVRGVSLKNLDEFSSRVQNLPGFNRGRMPSDFFYSRYHETLGCAVLKGFAKEIMAVTSVLKLFIKMVLAPQNLMRQHCKCFLTICLFLDIITLGDVAVRHVPDLRKLLEEHHELFLAVYGSSAFIPKSHYCMHLADVLQYLQCNMSSFVVERKHRCAKRIANRTFGNFEQTLVDTGGGVCVCVTISFSPGRRRGIPQ
jgi:hypothetical protein